MKQTISKIKITFLLISLCLSGFATSPSLLFLQLDKSSYVSGETIKFKNTIVSNNSENVLYVDLCGDATLYSSMAVLRSNNHWEGELAIPDSIQTGVYLLRAYTGSSDGTPTLVSQLVTIFNRFGRNEQNEAKKNDTMCKPLNQLPFTAENMGNGLKCTTNKATYKTNEPIQIGIENNIDETVAGLLFEVVKTESITKPSEAYTGPAYKPSDKIKVFNELSLCGKITKKGTTEAVAGELVYLSVPDSIAEINYAVTDSLGEFRFTLSNFYGEQAAIVQTKNKAEEFDIQLHPMFLLPPATIPFYVPLEVEEGEPTHLAIKRALFTKAYRTETSISKPAKLGFRYPFYGLAANVVYPGKYVDLIDFEEIAKEILPMVFYKCAGNECSLRLYEAVTGIYHSAPWVIIDGVPVANLATISKLNSLDIERVEIQPTIRGYGNLMISGALAIFTNKGNFSGIELPINAVRTNFNAYYLRNSEKSTDELYFKDVLSWETTLDHSQGNLQKEVKPSYETGKYVVVVRSIDSKGTIHQSVAPFTIEPKQ